MSLTHEDIKYTFKTARTQGVPFVFVSIVAEGVEEIIIIPQESFDAKEAFYLHSYSENGLVHVMNSQVYIRGLSFGEAETLNVIA